MRRRFLTTLVVVLVLGFGGLAAAVVTGATPRLGLDLQGGASVILTAPEGTDPEVLDKAVEIMRNRIEGLGGVQEPEIAVAGERNIIVQLPGVADRERAVEAVGTTGQLSFRPVLDILPTSPWVDAEDPEEIPEGVDPETGLTVEDDPTREAWLPGEAEGDVPSLVYHLGPALVLGADIDEAQALFEQQGVGFGRWVVSLDLSSEGGRKFQEATQQLAQFGLGDPRRQFAIVLDGTVISAPQIAPEVDPNVGISGGQAIITLGEGGEQEARDLSVVLRYGALPVALERAEVRSVSATLGADALRAGLIAGIGGLLLVSLFLMLYYRTLGVVAVTGLALFGALITVTFGLLGRAQGTTLTLAGVAGVIVAIGITADSSIIYFERIKEEVQRGRTLRSAVQDGFRPAFRTNLAGNTVTFLGALLLWILAIGPVKGFALALGIATVLDILILYLYTRPTVALLADSRLGEGGAVSIRGAVGRPVEVPG